jgi:hypothetical protein
MGPSVGTGLAVQAVVEDGVALGARLQACDGSRLGRQQ